MNWIGSANPIKVCLFCALASRTASYVFDPLVSPNILLKERQLKGIFLYGLKIIW